jgi:serine/threonine protein kinase
MKEIKCDYSVEIYDYYNDNNYYYIVMEKCDGDLFDLLENKKGFSESEIKTILLQLNVALKNMYSKNIIHRDLKPENIFIKYTSSSNIGFIVKLGDFGLSREYQQRQFSTNQINPTYAAPEIQKAKSENKNYDPTKCDLWSIGLLIYNLRFCDLPFFAFYAGNIPNKFDDKNLNDLIKKLIVIDPSKRINWENYFNHPFFR